MLEPADRYTQYQMEIYTYTCQKAHVSAMCHAVHSPVKPNGAHDRGATPTRSAAQHREQTSEAARLPEGARECNASHSPQSRQTQARDASGLCTDSTDRKVKQDTSDETSAIGLANETKTKVIPDMLKSARRNRRKLPARRKGIRKIPPRRGKHSMQ